MVVQTQQRYYTPEEYLELEAKAAYKSEYQNGEILPMTGGTTDHNDIAGNIYAHLKFALRRQPYKVFIGDVRLWISGCQLFTYPDVMVISGEPIFYEDRTDTVTNPPIIVEVLSKNTRNYDQGDKFDCYRTIAEFQEYILVDQYQVYVKHFVKTAEGYWLLKEYRDVTQTLVLSSIEFEIPLDEIYEGIKFSNT
ncbi:MAG: Uma2 family endonuclease [Cyanothece sp. SIO1E1]|nr:Uma2 family endonuclease [Cyanothece sp. SIO1E1]